MWTTFILVCSYLFTISHAQNSRLFLTSSTLTRIESINVLTVSPSVTTITCGVTTAPVTTCGNSRKRRGRFIEVEKPRIIRDGKLVELDERFIQPSKPVKSEYKPTDHLEASAKYSASPEKRQLELTDFFDLTDELTGADSLPSSFFEVTVAQTSIIGTTLTITMSLPGGSTVFNSFTYAGCTPEGAVICPTEATSTSTFTSTVMTTATATVTNTVTCAAAPVPGTTCARRHWGKRAAVIEVESPDIDIEKEEEEEEETKSIEPAKPRHREPHIPYELLSSHYNDDYIRKLIAWRQNNGGVATVTLIITITAGTTTTTETEAVTSVFTGCTPAGTPACLSTVTETTTVTSTTFDSTVTSTDYSTCGITTAAVTQCGSGRKKRDSPVIIESVQRPEEEISPDKASQRSETPDEDVNEHVVPLTYHQNRGHDQWLFRQQLMTSTSTVTQTVVVNGGTSTETVSSVAIVTYAGCTPPGASICSTIGQETVTSTVTENIVVLTTTTQTTVCGTTTAAVTACAGRRRRREAPFIEEAQPQFGEPVYHIQPDKPRKEEEKDSVEIEPAPRINEDEINPLLYGQNWWLFKQFIQTMTNFVTVTSTSTTTATALTTFTFTYAGCTPPGAAASLCP